MKPRKHQRPEVEYVDPAFENVAKAADEAAEEVLEEDRLLREHGIQPEHGRSQ